MKSKCDKKYLNQPNSMICHAPHHTHSVDDSSTVPISTPDMLCEDLLHGPCMLYLLAVVQIFFPGALVPVVSKVLLKPDLQVESCDMVSGLFQQVESTAAVDTPTQQDGNLERCVRGITPKASVTGDKAFLEMLVKSCERRRTYSCKSCLLSSTCDGC